MSYPFKICDSVHGFIRFGDSEKKVIDSRPFQRLRYIHQMGVAYLIYPGATHTRFEHSLGVMELVSRIYSTLVAPHNRFISLDLDEEALAYWRLIVRLAALCHDMGHLPFSHTAERSLLSEGGHEMMTLKLIQSQEMRSIWKTVGPHAEEDIIKLAITDSSEALSDWERVLSQMITEDNFGADRIDYLIRDGRYTGVGYGYFDYHQLIDTLRLLRYKGQLSLGVVASGIQSVESLWIARYMMHARVYQHPKTRVYSNHMQRFMQHYFQGEISTDVDFYLEQTDYTLLTALAEAAQKGNEDAACLLNRKESETHAPSPALKMGRRQFPVLLENKEVVSSSEASPFLESIPHQ